jgi:hypothetical protein
MANGTGLVGDAESTVLSVQKEEDSPEVIDWKSERAVAQTRLTKLVQRDDLLTKLSLQTAGGSADCQYERELIDREMKLIQAVVEFYNERINHVYERHRIQRIVAGLAM